MAKQGGRGSPGQNGAEQGQDSLQVNGGGSREPGGGSGGRGGAGGGGAAPWVLLAEISLPQEKAFHVIQALFCP